MKNNEFGNNLKLLRLNANISQRELGEILHVSNQAVSFWETGSREPDLDTLVKIAVYFEVSVNDLLSD